MAERRKTRRAYDEPGHAYYLTYSCVNRWPLLTKDRTRQWVVAAIDAARQRHGFDLYAYVIMPEHVHVLLRPRRDDDTVARILYDLKRPVSWKAKVWLAEAGNAGWLKRLTVRKGRREVFRFWLPGGAFDRNVFRDLSIREVADYIHANPVRRGIAKRPTDWPWSSARYWAGMDDAALSMDSLPT